MSKSWREQLTEIGGYENYLLGVPAGSVAKIIQELEDCRTENTRLQARLMHLEKCDRAVKLRAERATNRAAEDRLDATP